MAYEHKKSPNVADPMDYSIFREENHLRATYKLVTSEEHAFLIVLIDENDLEHGVRVISFNKKKKAPISERKLKVKIRGIDFLFDPVLRKLAYAQYP
jgi:hypothetical protein